MLAPKQQMKRLERGERPAEVESSTKDAKTKLLYNRQQDSQLKMIHSNYASHTNHQATTPFRTRRRPEVAGASSRPHTSINIRRAKIVERVLLGAILALAVTSLSSNYSIVQQVNANHAISEVWSEADGLRVKYATDHEDVLGAKASSELSLSSGRHEHKAPAGGESSSSDEAPSSGASTSGSGLEAGGASEGESSGGSSDATGESTATNSDSNSNSDLSENSEQGAADSARHNEKVAPDSALRGSQHQHKISSWSQSGRAQRAGEEEGARSNSDADEDNDGEGSKKGANSNKEEDADSFNDSTARGSKGRSGNSDAAPDLGGINSMSYSAMLEQAGVGDESELSNADIGANDGANVAAARQSEASARFRQPSRSFKDAVRMRTPTSGPESADSYDSSSKQRANEESSSFNFDGPSGSSKNEDESSSSDDETGSGGSKSGSDGEKSPSSSSSSSDDDENDGQSSFEHQERKPLVSGGGSRARDNMIDFDRVAGKSASKQFSASSDDETNSDASSGTGSESASDGESNNDDESSRGNYPKFFDQSNRALASGSERKSERLHQNANTPVRSSGQPMLNRQPQRAPVVAGGVQPDNFRKLAYFRSVHTQPAQQRSRVPVHSSNYGGGGESHHHSPDSVRDNFISPGHFPGSMPHLTHAASETQKKQIAPVADASAKLASKSSSSETTAASTNTADSIVMAREETSSQPATVAPATKQQDADAKQTTSGASQLLASDTTINAAISSTKAKDEASKKAADEFVVSVTPEPTAQAESQQIMAPTLLSTTTMAPMLPTPSTSTTSTTEAPSSTTSAAPSLKRFKFRKYR